MEIFESISDVPTSILFSMEETQAGICIMKNEKISATIASSSSTPTTHSNSCAVFGSPKQLSTCIYHCHFCLSIRMQKPCPEECQCNDRLPFTTDSTSRQLTLPDGPFNQGPLILYSPPSLAQLNDCRAPHPSIVSQQHIMKDFPPHFFASVPSPPSSLRIPSSFYDCHDHSCFTVNREGDPDPTKSDSVDTSSFPFCRPPLPLPFSGMDTLRVHDYERKDGAFLRRRVAAPSRTTAHTVAGVRDRHHPTACPSAASPEGKSPSPLDPSSSLSMEKCHFHCLSRSETSSASSFVSPPCGRLQRCENFFLQGYCTHGARCLFLHDECSWANVTVSPTTPSDTSSIVVFPSFSSPPLSSMKSPHSFTVVTPKRNTGNTIKEEGSSGGVTGSNAKSSFSISFTPCSSSLISSPQLLSRTPLLFLSSLHDSPPVLLNGLPYLSPSSPFSDVSLEKKMVVP